MNTMISHVSMVIDFIDVAFDSKEVNKLVKDEIESIFSNLSTNGLENWSIYFLISYTNGKKPLISKNKFGTSSKDKIKQISIVIPVPSKDKIHWGVDGSQQVYSESHFDKIIDNFHQLDIEYTDYSNRADYIKECVRKAIKKCFIEGITINKIKLKI